MRNTSWLSSTKQLQPANAAAAVIVTESGRYLLQLRDDLDWIFYPGHWGLFGGAVDPGEDAATAVRRELAEELGLMVDADQLRYFTRTTFDWSFAGLNATERMFFELTIPDSWVPNLVLTEGAALGTFLALEMLNGSLPLAPYDSFALWMHYSRGRIRAVT